MTQEKLLTISVAAYNVEDYLDQALESLADPAYVNRLEVFVVDDGGSDQSLLIAKSYEEKYPDTFHAIHKENGGYGSTVNYSIAHATGELKQIRFYSCLRRHGRGITCFFQEIVFRIAVRILFRSQRILFPDQVHDEIKFIFFQAEK